MGPLKVTFHLSAPMIRPEQPIHLDGLLAYAVVQESLIADRGALERIGYDRIIEDGLRDVLDFDGEMGVYCASVLTGFDTQYSIEWLAGMVRRTEDFDIAQAKDHFERDHKTIGTDEHIAKGPMLAEIPFSGIPKPMRIDKINLSSGEMRNFQFFHPAVTVDKMTAWCIGDAARIRELLSRHAGYIGRRGAAGFGVIDRVDIENLDEPEIWRWRYRNLPVRNLPDDDGKIRYATMVGNLRPPYWKAQNRCVVHAPVCLGSQLAAEEKIDLHTT